MKNISITVHHEGTFAYDPLVYEYSDVDVVENVNLGNCNFERLMKIIRECCLFPIHANFVKLAYDNGCKVELYVEHHGYDVIAEGVTEEVVDEELDDEIEMDDILEYVGLDHVGKEDAEIPNTGLNDTFLNKLVDGKFISDKDFRAKLDIKSSSSRNAEVEDSSMDDRFKVKEGFSYHVHNPNLPWNEMAQLLGMKFEHPDQLKEYLINYRVANGYQLWYRRNDYRNISVLCGKNVKEGRCASQKGKQKITSNAKSPKSPKTPKSKQSTSKKSQSPKTPKSPNATPNVDAAQKGCSFRLWENSVQKDVHLLQSCERGMNIMQKSHWTGWLFFKSTSRVRELLPHVEYVCKARLCKFKKEMEWTTLQVFVLGYCIIYIRGVVLPLKMDGFKEAQLLSMAGIRALKSLTEETQERRAEDLALSINRRLLVVYYMLNQDLGIGVSSWYSKQMWVDAYSHFIKPVGGSSLWVKSSNPPPLPLKKRIMPGRHRKKMIKHVTENVNQVSRVGRYMTCTNCWEKGHNRARCYNQRRPKPQQDKRKPSRKSQQATNQPFNLPNTDPSVDPSADPSVDSSADPTPSINVIDTSVADPTLNRSFTRLLNDVEQHRKDVEIAALADMNEAEEREARRKDVERVLEEANKIGVYR
ncbi:hypothetical protein Tco_1312294 [Tanacetum coccineum]